MTLFDVISDVLFLKKGDQFKTIEDESDSAIQPYMLNRWISMYSPTTAKIINCVNNRYWSVLSSKRDWYKFTLNILPRNRFQKIDYIKKAAKEKTEKSEDNKIIEILAHNLELSAREVKLYVEECKIDLTPYKKLLKNDKRNS